MQLAEIGLGLAGTAYTADNLVSPLTRQFIPGSLSSGIMGRVMEVVSTAVSAWGLGKLVGMANRRVGNQIEFGGAVLSAARAVSVPFPNYGITAQLPFSGNLFAGILPAAKATPIATTNGTNAALGVGSMGL